MTSMVTLIFLMLLASRSLAQEGCSKAEIMACNDPLLEVRNNIKETCEAVELAYDCLRIKAGDCLSDEDLEDAEDDFELLENVLYQHCIEELAVDQSKLYNPEVAAKCVNDNNDYFIDCVENEEIECRVVPARLDCITHRIAKKCGETTATLMRSEFVKLLQGACPGIEK